jgi:hypothetical protein
MEGDDLPKGRLRLKELRLKDLRRRTRKNSPLIWNLPDFCFCSYAVPPCFQTYFAKTNTTKKGK